MRRLVLAMLLAVTPMEAAAQPDPPAAEQYEEGGRSGFWTSRRPAKGGAYRWRMLGIGIAFALGSVMLVRHVIRKANAERSTTK